MKILSHSAISAEMYAAIVAKPGAFGPRTVGAEFRQRWAELVARRYTEVNVERCRRGHDAAERNAPRRLSLDQARAIKADPRPLSAIAADYGVSTTCAWKIKRGLMWKDA